jgi:hypothetical protein
VATIATVIASFLASLSVASADTAAVRVAVIAPASHRASGEPLAGSKIIAPPWWESTPSSPGFSTTLKTLIPNGCPSASEPGIQARTPLRSGIKKPSLSG